MHAPSAALASVFQPQPIFREAKSHVPKIPPLNSEMEVAEGEKGEANKLLGTEGPSQLLKASYTSCSREGSKGKRTSSSALKDLVSSLRPHTLVV
jgi:hypothetical protein